MYKKKNVQIQPKCSKSVETGKLAYSQPFIIIIIITHLKIHNSSILLRHFAHKIAEGVFIKAPPSDFKPRPLHESSSDAGVSDTELCVEKEPYPDDYFVHLILVDHVLYCRGNWIGEAPYKVGVPCSACPPSYGGSCRNNMCFPSVNSNFMYWFK